MAALSTARSAVAALAVGLLLVGCSGDDPEPSPDPSPRGPSESGPTQHPTTDGTESTSIEPTPTEPTVTPAAGLLLEEETSQLNAPEGEWELLPEIVSYASAAGHKPTAEVISLSDKENFASPASLDEQVKFHNRTLPEDALVERQPDVMLDGAAAYYVRWYEEGDLRIQHDIGLDHNGQVISIQMDLDGSDPAAGAALVASVLASFRWR